MAASPDLVKVWLDENHLMLLSCWARDGYTYNDIAKRIGISQSVLRQWRIKHPEIEKALSEGREIIDYKVENALLKSALGYKTRDVKVTTVIKNGKVIETHKETIDREQAPNVSAAQCWLYNRLPKKWKNMNSRANILEEMSEDTSVQIVVTRATSKPTPTTNSSKSEEDDWEDEVNDSILIRPMTEEEKREQKEKEREQRKNQNNEKTTKVESDEDDLDEWPDDWEDDEAWEDDEWED